MHQNKHFSERARLGGGVIFSIMVLWVKCDNGAGMGLWGWFWLSGASGLGQKWEEELGDIDVRPSESGTASCQGREGCYRGTPEECFVRVRLHGSGLYTDVWFQVSNVVDGPWEFSPALPYPFIDTDCHIGAVSGVGVWSDGGSVLVEEE